MFLLIIICTHALLGHGALLLNMDWINQYYHDLIVPLITSMTVDWH
uniref:Uncharacterized protein n=1 Tax=Arundo donax TaxID=35708 RepID=A0A0A8Z7F2_ARUDO